MRMIHPALVPLALSAVVLLGATSARAQDAAGWTAWTQSAEAVLAHQRLAGNARAQAKRRGAIRTVPHLFVYHRDRTPAFHMDGLRPGFERQLGLLIDAFRIDRSMVELETLLANAETPSGTEPSFEDLRAGRITMVLYVRDDCADCGTIRERLDAWLAERPALDPNRILIRMP